ncbi:hypothetical protein Ancab_028586 [Ancistrocladus abbreviatus]
MTTIIPCSASSISFIPGAGFTKKKNGCLTRFSLLRKSSKQTLSSQRVFLPLSTPIRVSPQYTCMFPQRHTTRTHSLSTTGTDVVVEEEESPIADEDSSAPPEEPSSSIEKNDDSFVKSDANVTSAQTKRSRPSRKSEMPPVKNEDLVPGAMFTGKVRSIQPFGAFVDFGAFTDGLVHVSRLSDSFVKDVSNVVSVGQEVKVKLVEVNTETGRISLSMRENDDKSKPQQRKEAVASSEKGRPPRRNPSRANQKKDEAKKSSKFVKGQDLMGTVKNLNRSGAFISLPEGEEGFLPSSEEADEGMGNIMGGSSLEVGQEVNVRVLRITRGQVTLTMKKEEDVAELDSKLNQGAVHAATNPFVLAFRKNKDIAAFLDEREKLEEEAQITTKTEISEAADETKEQVETGSEIPNAQGQPVAGGESIASVSTSLEDIADSKDKSILAVQKASTVEDASEEIPGSEDGEESSVSEISQSLDGAVEVLGVEAEVKSGAVDAEGKVSTVDQIMDGASATVELESDAMLVTDEVAVDQINSTENLADQEISVSQNVDLMVNDTVKISSPEAVSLGDTKSDPLVDAADQVSPLASAGSEEVVATDQAETGLQKDEAELPSSTDSHNYTKSDLSEDAVDKVALVDSVANEEVALTKQAETGLRNDGIGMAISTAETGILAAISTDDEDRVEKDEDELPKSTDSPNYTDLSEDAVDKVASVDSAASDEVALTNQAEAGLGKDGIGMAISTAETGIPAVVSTKDEDRVEKGLAELPSSTDSPNYTKSDLSEDAVDKVASVDSAASDEAALTNQAETGLGNDGIGIAISTAETGILAPVSTEDEDRVEKDEAELPSSADSPNYTDLSEDAVDKVTSVDSAASEEAALTNQAETGLGKDVIGIAISTAETVILATVSTEDEDRVEKGQAELPSSTDSPNYTKSDLSEDAVDKVASVDSAASEEVALKNQAETGCGNDGIGVAISKAETGILAAISTEDEDRVDQISSSDSVVSQELATETQIEDATAKEEVQIQTSFTEGQLVTSFTEKDETAASSNEESAEIPSQGSIAKDQLENDGKCDASGDGASSQILSSQIQVSEEKAEDKADGEVNNEMPIQTPAADSENSSPTPIDNDNGNSVPSEDGGVTKSHGPTSVPSNNEITPKATISPALVKQLREETGAGMMDCKKALAETGGDIVKAQEYLRKKGLASAEKKAGRITAEGRISSYIHDSRIGVLIEVNCETDFVSRGEIFKELVDDLAMQVAACPQVDYLVTEDIPRELVEKEREIEMQKEDLLSKPEQIRARIVDGRIRKRLEELALLEQPYIKNDKLLVKDWVKQTIATIGENVKVKRFVRFNLGEGLEKKSQDFAAEVAAQTAAKPLPFTVKEQPAVTDIPKPEKTPTVTVSAALVKQLREETGAGMMDCKKALSETGGDLEKAQEYLRKKGLSTADKKSSRLAAEGRIGSYIHDSRIGVLIEVNCETDFVGRSEKFKELVDDLAMQSVACPQVQFASIDDIPETIVSKEKEIEMQREDILSKPETIREKIVEGRVSKRLGELALLEQPFIRDDSMLVKDLVKQTVASLGENIKVRRLVRFTLGEQTGDAKAEPEA